MRRSRIVVCYHGCDKRLKEQILKRKTYLQAKHDMDPKAEKDLWLGSGIYFYEENPEAARKWAWHYSSRNRYNESPRIGEPAVLGAIIDLGECIDFASLDMVRSVKESYENVMLTEIELQDLFNQSWGKRQLDHAVVDRICDEYQMDGKPVDTVRAPFVQGDYIGDSNFREGTHTEICVRNPNRILYFFDPDREEATLDVNPSRKMKSLVKPVPNPRYQDFN